MSASEEIKLYFDFKSPFSYLAAEPAFALPEHYAVRVRWIPFQLRIKGKGERSQYSEWKAKYSYLDARRVANRRGGFAIKGPLKVYDSTPALIGALFAQQQGFFRDYAIEVFSRFFRRELEIDVQEAVAALVDELGHSGSDYARFVTAEGAGLFAQCMEEAHADHVFGVPLFHFRGEPFWGNDRLALLEHRLAEHGLQR